jgi:hypothetical protein
MERGRILIIGTTGLLAASLFVSTAGATSLRRPPKPTPTPPAASAPSTTAPTAPAASTAPTAEPSQAKGPQTHGRR